MSILGSLIISLEAQTASFISGMTGASKTAKETGHQIESAFSRVGDVAGKALAPFGEIGKVIGETLGSVGESAGAAVVQFGKLGGSLGAVAAVGAGAGASIIAVAGASIALATHTAESIAKMYELAQSTGVGIKDLSAFGFAAKELGIDNETLAKSLEKMNKSVFAAATAAPGTVNAFTRLGISLRDTEGQIRPTRDILLDLAAKFAAMPDGVSKTALAMQIFGKGGAVLIPFLNEGKDGLEEFLAKAKEFGVEIDANTGRSAHEFTIALADIQAEGQGLAISLTRQLLPALQAVAEAMRDAPQRSALGDFSSGMGTLTKIALGTGDALINIFREIAAVIALVLSELTEGAIGFARIAMDAAHGNWQAMAFDAKDAAARIHGVWDNFLDESKNNWQNFADFTQALEFGPKKPPNPLLGKDLSGISSRELATGLGVRGEFSDSFSWAQGILGSLKKPSPGLEKGKENNTALKRVEDRIKALKQEISDWDAVGSAGSQAEALIAEATRKGNEELAKLNKEAAREKTGSLAARKAADNAALAQAAGAASVYSAAVKTLTGDLDKQGLKLEEQDKAAIALAAAYQQGGAAIASAAIGKQFAEQASKLAVLSEAHDLLASRLGNENPLVEQLGTKLASLTAMLERNKEAAQKLASDNLNAQLEQQINSFVTLSPLVRDLAAAYLQGEDAIRKSRIELELAKFAQDELDKGVVVSESQRASKRAVLEAADRQAYESALTQEAAQFSLAALYDQQIVKLSRVREIVQQYGQATLLIDAAMFEAQNRLIRQWDDSAIAAGKFRDRVHAVFNELVLQGKEAGSAIARAFVGAFDGAESELAKLIVTGKANFQGVLQSLEESIVKAGLQKAVGGIVAHIPGLSNIAGLLTGGPQLGTDGNPMVVRFQSGLGAFGLPFQAGGAPTAIPGVIGAVGGENLGLPVGVFTQGLNTMSAAQTVFAGKMGSSWFGIAGMFRGAVSLMTNLFHLHTASVIAGQAAQTGAAVTSQAAQTAAASSGAAARGNIGLGEHLKAIFRHAAGAAAAAFHKVFDALPFPLNVIIAPIAAAGAFAGTMAWGAVGSAARGAVLGEDMPIFAHAREMILPAGISDGLQEMIKSSRQGGQVPSVQQFAPSSTSVAGRGDQFHTNVGINVSAWDTVTGAQQIKKQSAQIMKEVRRAFQTGYLNPRRLARV